MYAHAHAHGIANRKTHKFFENNYQNTCFRQKKIVSLQNVISKKTIARSIKETPMLFYEDARYLRAFRKFYIIVPNFEIWKSRFPNLQWTHVFRTLRGFLFEFIRYVIYIFHKK